LINTARWQYVASPQKTPSSLHESELRRSGDPNKRKSVFAKKQAVEMSGSGSMESQKAGLSALPTPLGNPCGDSLITAATATTIMYLKTGKARRKPAIKAALTARGL
jgi:hypothetical protein